MLDERSKTTVVVSTFGVIGSTAVGWLERVEESASLKGRPFLAEPAGPKCLCELVSLVTVLEAAQIVLSGHSQGSGPEARVPDGA